MSKIRLWLRLIALVLLADFCIAFWMQGDGRSALIPPLVGSVVASFACWQDAASSSQRKLVAVLSTVTAICVALGVILELQQPSPIQMPILAVLLLISVAVCVHGWRTAKRRRMQLAGYLTSGPASSRF